MEFKNRAVRFGIIFAFTFPLQVPDSQDSSARLADWLAACFYLDAERRVQILLEWGALVLTMTAFIRTWASAYLHVEVVYGRGRARRRSENSVPGRGRDPYRRAGNSL